MCYQPAGSLFPKQFHPWTALSNTQEWGGVGGILSPPLPCWLLAANPGNTDIFWNTDDNTQHGVAMNKSYNMQIVV